MNQALAFEAKESTVKPIANNQTTRHSAQYAERRMIAVPCSQCSLLQLQIPLMTDPRKYFYSLIHRVSIPILDTLKIAAVD